MEELQKHLKRYKIYITTAIVVLLLITTLVSVGFGALNQNLNIAGDVKYDEYNNILYNVLKREAGIGTYAKEYSGEHQDSFTEEPTHSIYHWHASNNTNGNIILDKWNVLFGGFCWQMIRTTDTGGVRLLYNGVPSDGQCNNTGSGQQIGTSAFNSNSTSLASLGYMYNTVYPQNTVEEKTFNVLSTASMTGSSNYYFGTGVTYSNGSYTLTGVTQNKWSNVYSSSGGLYTCISTTNTSCSYPYYIVGGTASTVYGFVLRSGNLENYYDTNISFGTSYNESGETYTLSGVTTISKSEWFNNYSSFKDYYVCRNNSTTCTELYYIFNTFPNEYRTWNVSDNYLYGNDFSYDSNTNTYSLGSDTVQFWNWSDLTNDRSIKTHHYSCLNDTGQCTSLAYLYNWGSRSYEYIILENGKSIEDAVNEMLYNDNVNQTNSTIKDVIDNWYATNMTDYTDKLEDTVFCNNRTQTNANVNELNPNGSSNVYFNYNSLKCENDTDKFSVSNNKARLIYPVGLANYREMGLLYTVYPGPNNVVSSTLLRKTGVGYWLISPYRYSNYGQQMYIDAGGSERLPTNNGTFGVRPMISLKPGTEFVSGTGSKNNPYVVE